MSTEMTQTELFDQYLGGLLARAERAGFEDRLIKDPDFKAAFNLHKEIDLALLDEDLQAFKKQLNYIQHDLENQIQDDSLSLPDFSHDDDIDLAILEQDILGLRAELDQIHNEMEAGVTEEPAPIYAGVDHAVGKQDSFLLHEELGKFDDQNNYPADEVMTEKQWLEREVEQAIAQEDIMELRGKIGDLLVKVPDKKSQPLKRRIILTTVAAAAILVLFITSGIFNQASNVGWFTNEHQFNRSFEHFQGPGDARGVGTEDARINQYA